MNVAAGPELAAAVSNAGGLGVIGGLGYTPKILRQQVRTVPYLLAKRSAHTGSRSRSSPLPLDQGYQGRSCGQEPTLWRRPAPPPGRRERAEDKREFYFRSRFHYGRHELTIDSARVRPQYDYTKGQLPDLLDVIIEEKTALFVCAVGVPPKWAVEKLHKAGIPVMNVRAHR